VHSRTNRGKCIRLESTKSTRNKTVHIHKISTIDAMLQLITYKTFAWFKIAEFRLFGGTVGEVGLS
jgi:hypothetical protein